MAVFVTLTEKILIGAVSILALNTGRMIFKGRKKTEEQNAQ